MDTITPNFLKYNLSVLGLTIAIVGCLVTLIINVTDSYKSEKDLVTQAITWQSRTKGIVTVPSNLSTSYKHAKGQNYISNNGVNTIVFGSSTMMTIRNEVFPKRFKVYNYATNSNPMSRTIGELRFFTESNDNIQWAILAVDYSLGFPFQKAPLKPHQLNSAASIVPLADQLKDAITLDRLKITFESLWAQINQDDPTYKCPRENQIGRDFGTIRDPGTCRGYRIDGSATLGLKRMSRLSWKGRLNDKGMKKYIGSLEKSDNGKINATYLEELKKLNAILKSRGGYLTVILPPLAPEAEVWLINSHVGPNLLKFKSHVTSWARDNQVMLIDSGKSESYGCTYDDFFDQHHALEFCYEKIISSHFL